MMQMMRSLLNPHVWSGLGSIAILASPVAAQVGRITGTVVDTAGTPVSGAHVAIAAVARSMLSGHDGRFAFADVPAGSYELRVHRIGSEPASVDAVVRGDEVTSVVVRLRETAVTLQGIVVSVSRRAEKVTDAPAAVTAFDDSRIASGLGNAATAVLKEAPGITLTQVGVTASFVNGRGFNRVFNTRWLTLEDDRVALLAENGMSIGEHTTIPRIDISSIEVTAGPGSALYGANASGGLMSVRTKDPREFPGATVEIAGGLRDYHDAQVRYAGSTGRWGYKLAGQDQATTDWTDTVYYPAITAGSAPLREVARDFGTRVTRGGGALRYYFDGGARAGLNAGASLRTGLGQTAQGRYRISNWQYQSIQAQFSTPRWFAQVYSTHSNSGNTYQLNQFTLAQARFPGLSADSVRKLSAFHVDGRILVGEVQNNFMAGGLVRTGVRALDNTYVTWGAQARRDRIGSYGTVYSDALTGEPVYFNQSALYVQAESPLSGTLRFVGAARYDRHSRFDSRWSPKAGLVYNVARDQSVRLTYNEAFLAPTVLQTDLNNYNAGARILARGNSTGFDVKDASGTLLNSVAPVGPETNRTWELGYKGAIRNRLFADVTGYRSRFSDFHTSAVLIANPSATPATFAYNRATGQLIADGSGNPVQLRSFINVGDAVIDGIDAAVRFYFTDRIAMSSTASFVRVDTIKAKPTDPGEATAFNTSPTRVTLALEMRDVPKRVEITATGRHVVGYAFRSGADWGRIPTFGTIGVSARYRVPEKGMTLLLQADNILTCVAGTTTPPSTGIGPTSEATYTPRRSCGDGVRHHEILNMPAVGAMVFLGVRVEWPAR